DLSGWNRWQDAQRVGADPLKWHERQVAMFGRFWMAELSWASVGFFFSSARNSRMGITLWQSRQRAWITCARWSNSARISDRRSVFTRRIVAFSTRWQVWHGLVKESTTGWYAWTAAADVASPAVTANLVSSSGA